MEITEKIYKDLCKKIDEKYRINSYGFFKEKVKIIGVRNPEIMNFIKEYWKEVKTMTKKEIYLISEDLFKKGFNETLKFGLSFVYKHKNYSKEDLIVYEKWLKNYIKNWGSCDDFCTHALGEFFYKFPNLADKVFDWAMSENLWLRRASAVSLIFGIRKGLFTDKIFQISDFLLLDKEDLVQKAYGWALKELSNKDRKIVFEYVMKNKSVMPRTALRYAIEKMPEELKSEAMKK